MRIFLLAFLFISASALAEVYPSTTRHGTYIDQTAEKFGSGVGNTAFGWLEIPKNIVSRTHKDGVIEGVVIGIPVGVFYAFGRTLVGALNLVTFPIPGSIYIDPRYVWDNWHRPTTFGKI